MLLFVPLGGEKGIRTPETLLMFTRFPGGPVQPLLHLSENAPKSTQYFPILQMTAVFSPFGIRVSTPFRSGGVLPSAPFAARLPSRKEPDLCRFRGNENGTTRGPSVFQAERGSIVGLAHTSIYRLCTMRCTGWSVSPNRYRTCVRYHSLFGSKPLPSRSSGGRR